MSEQLEKNATSEQPLLSRSAYAETLLGRFDAGVLSGPIPRGVLVVLLCGALIAPTVQATRKITETDSSPYREGGTRQRTALGRWIPTVELAGQTDRTESPYGFAHWFPLPTTILVALQPFSWMGLTPAGLVWALLKVIGFVAVMLLIIRTIEPPEWRFPLGVVMMAGAFGIRPIISDIQHGNVNIFMMMWAGLAWALWARGRDVLAGLAMSLAIVTKVTPALLLVYFAYKRAWKLCAAAGVGLVLVFLVIPGFYFGFAENVSLLVEWFNMLIAPYALENYAAYDLDNQSLYGTILRVGDIAGLVSVEHMPTEDAAVVGMEAMARPASFLGRLIRPTISISIVATLAFVCRTSTANRRDPRLLLEAGLVMLAMLLMSERTWKHHGTTLPIVFLAVWFVLTCLPFSARLRFWFTAGLCVQWLCLVGSSSGFLGDRLADAALTFGIFCWGLLLAFVQTAILIRAANRLAANESSAVPAALSAGQT